MNERLILEASYLLLNKPPVFNYKSVIELLKSIKTLKNIWNLTEKDINDLSIKQKDKEKLIYKHNTSNLNEYIDKITKINVKILTLEDEKFPKKLKNLNYPPIMIFYQGDVELLSQEKIIAIVGTRKASAYGISLVKDFVDDIANYNYPIITGTAIGIDSTVIKTSLDKDIKVISVLSSGINNISPVKSKELLDQIIDHGGCCFTEFPPDTPSHKSNYPIRAKLIAAIASEFILIEIPKESGALLVAQEAFNFGKNIYCPTSYYNDQNFIGGHKLIDEGMAMLVKKYSDIAEY